MFHRHQSFIIMHILQIIGRTFYRTSHGRVGYSIPPEPETTTEFAGNTTSSPETMLTTAHPEATTFPEDAAEIAPGPVSTEGFQLIN